MRGKQVLSESHTAGLGLIPAHAGKTRLQTVNRRSAWDHPRSCGENRIEVTDIPALSGSSPLMRGKLADGTDHGTDAGLIPAHAGKTSRSRAGMRRPWAHPRSRGENGLLFTDQPVVVGSSPLTRGKHGGGPGGGDRGGLIPAHAGKTHPERKPPHVRRAHPRSRGENHNLSHTTHFLQGSSPLTRGKLISFPHILGVRGLIPAHAGKTRHNASD